LAIFRNIAGSNQTPHLLTVECVGLSVEKILLRLRRDPEKSVFLCSCVSMEIGAHDKVLNVHTF